MADPFQDDSDKKRRRLGGKRVVSTTRGAHLDDESKEMKRLLAKYEGNLSPAGQLLLLFRKSKESPEPYFDLLKQADASLLEKHARILLLESAIFQGTPEKDRICEVAELVYDLAGVEDLKSARRQAYFVEIADLLRR